MGPDRKRLDEMLVARGLAPSRSRARDAVARGTVLVDGVRASKPGQPVGAGQSLALDGDALRYVSRGALKLLAALDAFGLDPAGRIALDLGASTGGFTEVLLECGAARVYAVDVGHGQLDRRLAGDPRVVSLERVNARDLSPAGLPERPGAIVADLSFISLRLALPPALALAAPGCWGAFLVKPQFEAGREAVGRGGVVRDEAAARAAAEAVAAWLAEREGWSLLGLTPSPILGGDGNREFLLGARRAGAWAERPGD